MENSQTRQIRGSVKSYLNLLFETYEKYISSDIFGKLTFAFWEFIKDVYIPFELEPTAEDEAES